MAAEKQFEDKIKAYLKERGHWFVKYFANRNTRAGVPDILACVRGRFVAIEVKASTGKPSELQLYNVRQIRQAGGIAIVLYPERFDDFKRLISDIETGKYQDWKQYRFDNVKQSYI